MTSTLSFVTEYPKLGYSLRTSLRMGVQRYLAVGVELCRGQRKDYEMMFETDIRKIESRIETFEP